MLNYGLQCSVMNLLLYINNYIPLQRVQTSCFLVHRVLLARPMKEDIEDPVLQQIQMSHYGLSVSTTFTLRPTQSFFLSFVNETTYVSIIRQRSMTLDPSIWRNSYLNLLFLSCVLLYQMLFLPEVFCHSGDLPPQICTIHQHSNDILLFSLQAPLVCTLLRLFSLEAYLFQSVTPHPEPSAFCNYLHHIQKVSFKCITQLRHVKLFSSPPLWGQVVTCNQTSKTFHGSHIYQLYYLFSLLVALVSCQLLSFKLLSQKIDL